MSDLVVAIAAKWPVPVDSNDAPPVFQTGALPNELDTEISSIIAAVEWWNDHPSERSTTSSGQRNWATIEPSDNPRVATRVRLSYEPRIWIFQDADSSRSATCAATRAIRWAMACDFAQVPAGKRPQGTDLIQAKVGGEGNADGVWMESNLRERVVGRGRAQKRENPGVFGSGVRLIESVWCYTVIIRIPGWSYLHRLDWLWYSPYPTSVRPR